MRRQVWKLCGMLLVALALVAARGAEARTTAAPVEGSYDFTLVAEGAATFNFVLVVRKEGEALKTEVRNGGDINITSIALEGEKVTLTAVYQGDSAFPLPGTLNDTGMGGKWEAGGYGGTWSARRRAEP